MKRRRQQTRMEAIAQQQNSGTLVDYLQRYANSAGEATRLFAQNGDPAALDVIEENANSLVVLAAELRARGRNGGMYLPAPEPHLEDLLAKFSRKQGILPPS